MIIIAVLNRFLFSTHQRAVARAVDGIIHGIFE